MSLTMPRDYWYAALTPTQREKAVRLWREGATMKQIARELGVTFRTVKHEIEYRRGLYPRKYAKREER